MDAVAGAAQLNIHALTHRIVRPTSAKQKPKIDRPRLSCEITEKEWFTFVKRWNLFKRGTDISNGQVTTQLWQCCETKLKKTYLKILMIFKQLQARPHSRNEKVSCHFHCNKCQKNRTTNNETRPWRPYAHLPHK